MPYLNDDTSDVFNSSLSSIESEREDDLATAFGFQQLDEESSAEESSRTMNRSSRKPTAREAERGVDCVRLGAGQH